MICGQRVLNVLYGADHVVRRKGLYKLNTNKCYGVVQVLSWWRVRCNRGERRLISDRIWAECARPENCDTKNKMWGECLVTILRKLNISDSEGRLRSTIISAYLWHNQALRRGTQDCLIKSMIFSMQRSFPRYMRRSSDAAMRLTP